MRDLGKWQIISFISRGMAMLLGLVQSFVIIRILSLTEWGIIQLGISIGGALGIYQHLGLASASTREISSAEDDDEIFKIFVTSVMIRYLITLPIAVGLFIFSGYIATNLYHTSALVLPLKLYAVTLVVQGFQSILNSVIAGTKKFRNLFLYQVAIAFVSVIVFIPFVYFYRVNGYFYAFFIFNFVSTTALWFLAFRPLKTKFALPYKNDLLRIFKEIFSVSLAIYLVKIIYTNWEKMGSNLIGLENSPEVVAIFAFALLYSKKLMNISDAVTDVNLPVLSEKFSDNFNDFKQLFSKNFDKVYVFVLFSALTATYWAPQITQLLVGSDKYNQSFSLIPPIILAFIFYSLINIVKSSVFIPAKQVKSMIITFVLLIVGTGSFFLLFQSRLGVLPAMAWGMALGGFLGFLFSVLYIRYSLKLHFFIHDHWLLLIQSFVICLLWDISNLSLKFIAYLALLALFVWGVMITNFVTKNDLLNLIDILNKFKARYVKTRS